MINPRKLKYLTEPWTGWRYMWIETKDHGLSLHEAYKFSLAISYTENPTDPMPNSKVIREIADMLDNDLIFTESEIDEFNRSRISDDSGSDS